MFKIAHTTYAREHAGFFKHIFKMLPARYRMFNYPSLAYFEEE
jgi:hypothetical protein